MTYTILNRELHYDLIKMLSVTCHATRSQIFEFISRDQLDYLVKERILVKTDIAWDNGKAKAAYRLNTNAQAVVKREFRIKSFYKSESPTHDIYLAKKYMELEPEEKETTRTEAQTRNDINQAWKNNPLLIGNKFGDKFSGPDFSYKRKCDGKWMFVEISNGYKIPKIEAKFNCAESVDAEMVFREIKKTAYMN